MISAFAFVVSGELKAPHAVSVFRTEKQPHKTESFPWKHFAIFYVPCFPLSRDMRLLRSNIAAGKVAPDVTTKYQDVRRKLFKGLTRGFELYSIASWIYEKANPLNKAVLFYEAIWELYDFQDTLSTDSC